MPGQANASAITLHVHLNHRKCYLEIILSYSTIFLLVFIDNFRNSHFNFFNFLSQKLRRFSKKQMQDTKKTNSFDPLPLLESI